MNLIEKLVIVKQICTAYGAKFELLPKTGNTVVRATLPYAGAQSDEVALCFETDLGDYGFTTEKEEQVITITV